MRTKIYQLAILMFLALLLGCVNPDSTAQKSVKVETQLAHIDSGFIDKSGKLAIRISGKFHGKFSNDLARVWKTVNKDNKESDKWGYIDATGKFVIQPIYDWALPFSDDFAAVNIGGKISNVTYVSRADVVWADIEGGKWVFIDKKGKVQIETPYIKVGSFHDGLAPVESNNKWGYIDKAGKIVVPPQFEDAMELNDGMGAVLLGHKWGFINKSGKQVIEPKYSSRIELMDGRIFMGIGFSNGLAWVDNGKDYRQGKKWGVIDTSGTFVIEPSFDSYGSDFNDGLSSVKINKKTCIIDKNGKVIIETEYDNIIEFSEGIASFSKGKKWGAIDKLGKVVIETQLDNQFSFSQGLAVVGIGEFRSTTGYIDKSGAWVISAKNYGDAWEFQKVYYENNKQMKK